MKHILCRFAVLLGISLSQLGFAEDDSPIQLRRGIPNFFLVSAQYEAAGSSDEVPTFCDCDAVPVVEAGGIGTQPVYCHFLQQVCQQWYPHTKYNTFTFSHKSEPEGKEFGSPYGVYGYRNTDATFGNKIGGRRLGFIDFAQSDLDKTEQQVIDAVEGIIRQSYADLDIVFVYAGIPEFVSAYLEGSPHPVITWYEKVAEHYNVPAIDFAKNAANRIKAGELTYEEYIAGQKWCGFNWDKLPESKGNDLDLALFAEFIQRCYEAKTDDPELIHRKYPAPISATNYEQAGCVAYEFGQYDKKDWQEGVERIAEIPSLRHYLVSSTPGAVYQIRFRGKRCGFMDILDADTADWEYRVDGNAWKMISAESGKNLKQPQRRVLHDLVTGLDPSQEHVFAIRLAKDQPESPMPRSARLGVLLIDGQLKNPYAGMSRLEYIDAVYSQIPPMEFEFSQDRWRYLPKTMEKLQNGGTLRIVLLGDSIMGDTHGSSMHLLLERMYPNCKVEWIISNRGSTGCWYYKDENRVEDYVFRHNPDLLIIGGISNRDDTEAIRSVVRQVRAKQSPEIMLVTQVMGAVGDPHVKNWTYKASDPENYRYKLRKVAQEEKCEFADLCGPFFLYIKDSGSSYGWFMRDGVHANDRGSQVIGRLLLRYFEPKEKGFVSLIPPRNTAPWTEDAKPHAGWLKYGGDATFEMDGDMIVGKRGPGYSTFLCTDRPYTDFIIKFDVKFDIGSNSGLQFRSHTRPGKHEDKDISVVYGYQCEVDPRPTEMNAFIFDESRRGWLVDQADYEKNADRSVSVHNGDDWNEYTVKCEGTSIKTWLNGVPMTDIVDDEDREGFFGLQMHSGPQGQVRWRNIRVKEIPKRVSLNFPPLIF
jgi:hypothetical protein